MVNMNICKNKIVKNIKDSNGNIIIGIYVILSGCKVFDYITFGLSRNIGKSVVLVRPGWSYLFLFVNTLLRKQEVLKYMGEVMICRGGRGSGKSGGKNYGEGGGTLTTLVFTSNEMWTVPEGIIDNYVSVRLFGGGGGGWVGEGYNGGGGGGGGYMNNDILKLSAGETINITVGKGGNAHRIYEWDYNRNINAGTSGGTTSFGGYLVANGGSSGYPDKGGSGGAGGGGGYGIGYQFGGGGGRYGNGGVWGGGGGARLNGGTGGIYGGGGSVYTSNFINDYGVGVGGEYGGNAGINGTNTIGWTNVDMDFGGSYITGNGICFKVGDVRFGGGGFGGNGGNTVYSGGGGYGGDGGGVNWTNEPNDDYTGGGGGGYGKTATGGTGDAWWNKYSQRCGAGGGGGYYCPGGDGNSYGRKGGGGGMLYNGIKYGCGGYGCWKNSIDNGWFNAYNGGSGICIVQFYRDL